ncbi:hypothetical protein BHAOGJBA_4159 [Methylobacterium hispanicum]|uniref:Uncharacterized protein n=1 Tax=Methylobacterium hispanicum TaxID=270350 RepID=A0AAV4ZR08_9HYPH|nr:hypothetical protein [Methylobacterium hispanicum]GJD90617.1 hypothetical protein BHAOGJBA_4159 [Methylobacterium hispanicum]
MKHATIVLAAAIAATSAHAAGQQRGGPLRRTVCEGPFESGSGMAGSLVGDACALQADSDPERLVQSVCDQKALCRVEALVRPGSPAAIVKVLGVRQLAMAPAETSAYLEKVAGRLDGILAPQGAGCDNPQDTAQDRVSVQLNGLTGPAIQIYGRYCAVTSGSGDRVADAGFQAILRGNCAKVGVPDADLRTGRAGEKAEIVVSVPATGPTRIDGEALVRCPIRQAYTPRWWIDGNYTFRGRYPR